jgi:hypothetical protein
MVLRREEVTVTQHHDLRHQLLTLEFRKARKETMRMLQNLR